MTTTDSEAHMLRLSTSDTENNYPGWLAQLQR